MSQAQQTASRLRLMLLILGVLCWIPAIFWLFNPLWPQWHIVGGETGTGLVGVMLIEWDERPYLIACCVYLGLFLLSQWLFLSPRGPFRINLAATGRPLKLSVIIAALMAALLSFGLIASLLEIPNWWMRFFGGNSDGDHRVWLWIILAACWLFWSIIFFLFWRTGDRNTQLSRMLRGLFAGSILELLVAGPVQVWILRRHEEHECYCARGSYTGLIFGGTVLLWVFGPGLALYVLREKQRRTPLIAPDVPAK